MTAEEVIKRLQELPPLATVGSFEPVFNEFAVISSLEFIKDDGADTGYIQIYMESK